MGVRITTVGTVGVEVDGRTLAPGALDARRARLVLVALALAPAGLTSRALAERVWDAPPSTWAAALRGTVLALRAALDPIGLGGQELVRTTAGGWALAPGTVVDLLDAPHAAERAESELAAGNAETALEIAESARLRGALLPDEEGEWLDEPRHQLEAAVERLLAVGAEAALALGRTASAASAARELIDVNPLDERAHRILIRSLAVAGDRAGAIRAFEECRAVLAEQLGMDPGPETAAVYLEVLRSGAAAGGGTLPAPPRNGFFGRQEELARIAAGLAEPGIVAVLGRGGIGKSRLALHAAHAVAGIVPGGRYWVPLGDLPTPDLVAVTVARAVGAEEGPDPIAAATAVLAPAGAVLLVLDGVEDVVDGLAETVAALAAANPELRLLATSRRPLDLPGERKVELAPFALPVDDAELARGAAVQLLGDRLASRGQALALDARNAAAVRALCARCGGVPLALELAAAQLGSMAVADLLDALPRASQGAEDVVASLLAQSYQALDDREAALFRAWGAVDGSLSLGMVASLVGDGTAPGRVARLLAELADGGLLGVDRSGPRWRYRQDDQVRAFARARLDEQEGSGGVLATLSMAVRALLPEDARTPPSGFREAVTDASDAVRTVLEAAATERLPRSAGLELAFRLHRYWTVVGLAEGRYWLRRLLDGAADEPWAPLATFAAGYLAYWAGDTADARRLLEAAAEALRGTEDAFAARALVFASGIADDEDRPEAALADTYAAIELAATTDDANLQVSAAMGVSSILAERGDRAAIGYGEQALAIARERGSRDQLLATLATASMVAWQVGDLETARRWIDEGDPLMHEEPRIARAVLACASAGVAFADGRLEPAARLIEIAIADGEGLGVERELPLAYALRARIALARGRRLDAVAAAESALDMADRLDYRYPRAIALETVALLVEDALGADLRATAAEIRRAGDRPPPSSLPAEGPLGTPLDPDAASELAREALRG